MITHFLTRDFSLADIPEHVSDHHYDNFADALRQRDRADSARQDALDLQYEIGPAPCGSDKKRLASAWRRYYAARDEYDAMVQEAMEMLNYDYTYGFDH